MKIFAIIKDSLVVNTITADERVVVETLHPGFEVVEVLDGTLVHVGGPFINNTFVELAPFESWVLDEETLRWKSPVSGPEYKEGFGAVWNEEALSWEYVENSPEDNPETV
jgi:hypothetical protein